MKNKGITIISLIITIIILLILAGISIFTLTGENGLLNRAKQAKQNTLEIQKNENITLADYENKIDETINSNREIEEKNIPQLVYIGTSKVGKNQDLNKVEVAFNQNLEAGKYVIFATRVAVNNSAIESNNNQTTNYFQLSGADTIKVLNYDAFREIYM